MITADQLIAHAIGDYILQSHWMAQEKTKRWLPCLLHVFFYSIPFGIWFAASLPALLVILGSHYLIDRYRLARHVILFKNLLFCPNDAADKLGKEYNPDTGFPADTPPWLAFWLLIVVDNFLHVVINGVALKYL